MEKLEVLEQKIGDLLKEVSQLKHENERVVSEIRFLETENNRAKEILLENKLLNEEKAFIKKKIDTIINKFEKLKI
jgi:regulator of replication initiation timing